MGVGGGALLSGCPSGRRVQLGASNPGFAARFGDASLVLVPERQRHAE